MKLINYFATLPFDRRHLNSFLSVLLFISLCYVVMLIPWESDFGAAGLVFITEIIGTVIGILYIVLRKFKINIRKTNFIYNYFGILNIVLGLLMIYILGVKSLWYFGYLLILINFVVGGFILFDIFSKDSGSSNGRKDGMDINMS